LTDIAAFGIASDGFNMAADGPESAENGAVDIVLVEE
jgi:hypothetical protein